MINFASDLRLQEAVQTFGADRLTQLTLR